MQIKLSNKFIIFFLLLFISFFCEANEEVIFTVDSSPITTIDLNQRINYLNLISNINIKDYKKQKYINDLISVKLFDEFAKRKKLKIDDEEINSYYNVILKNSRQKLDNYIDKKIISKEIIIKNIIYDLQRKKILEYYLDQKIKKINLNINQNNIVDMYDIRLSYFIIDNSYKDIIKDNYNKLLKKDLTDFTNFLKNSKIKFNFFKKEIINLGRIHNKIENIILNNENKFYIEEDNYIMTGIVKKNLKKNIDLKYSFFQIKAKNKSEFNSITSEKIDCNNIENKKSDLRLVIKEYKSINLNELNIDVFQNLTKKNQRLIVKNSSQQFLILLCEIDYNKQMAKDKLFENKINKIADEIEMEFVKTKKKEFNFEKLF